jgi:hypothetical protein
VKKILESIAAPEFWVLVVIVGVLINLASAYLKPLLDRAFSSISLRLATRTERQRRQRLRRIECLRGDINEQLLASFAELRAGIWSVILFIFFMFTVSFTYMYEQISGRSSISFLPYITSTLVMYVAMRYLLDFVNTASEIREARRLEDRHDQADT